MEAVLSAAHSGELGAYRWFNLVRKSQPAEELSHIPRMFVGEDAYREREVIIFRCITLMKSTFHQAFPPYYYRKR